MEHIITRADKNVEIIVEEERKSFDKDLEERFANKMNYLWSQKNDK